MSQLPDFSSQGYEVIAELDREEQGSWTTYLANQLRPAQLPKSAKPTRKQKSNPATGGANSPPQVVIREFRFTQGETSWAGFQAYEREQQILQELNHPGIPKYLRSFETPQGFCLVQESKNAIPLTDRTSFTPAEIKSLAQQILQILAYLHRRIPPILHRNIRPENIWIGREPRAGDPDSLPVYLMNFGLAGTGKLDTAGQETPGITAPEYFQGQPLTPAADLYGLGGTLICLLTGTPSQQLSYLLNDQYQFNLSALPTTLDPRFVNWLKKLVAADPQDRYPSARKAREALEPISIRAGEDSRVAQSPGKFPVGGAIAGLSLVGAMLVAVGASQWFVFRKPTITPIVTTSESVDPTPASDANLVKQGDRLAEAKRYEEAVTAYTQATEANPQNAEAWFGLGLNLLRLERYAEALPACVKATELNPQDSAAWYNRGVVLGKLDRYAEAIPMYETALKLDSQDPMSWLNKGYALYKTGRKEEAIAAYDQALKLKPDYALVWNNRCLILNDWKRYQEALPDCEKATQYDPELHYGWNNKGEALYHLGRYQEALVAFNKALAIKPNYKFALENRQQTLDKLKQ